MQTTNVKCPICGTINYNLYLEETDGWMECQCCGNTTCLMENFRIKRVPVFTGKQLAQMIKTTDSASQPLSLF